MQVLTIEFITDLFNCVADFLLSEPIVYFTGILILFMVGSIIKRICS